MIEELSKTWLGGVVLITDPDVLYRPAALLYDTAQGGFAWVEPHAWDPEGASSHALHVRPGAKLSLIDAARPERGFLFITDQGERGMVYPWDPTSEAAPELATFLAGLEASGLDLVAERERIRPQVEVLAA